MATLQSQPIAHLTAEITALRVVGTGYYFLSVKAPEIARAAVPGQFVQVRVSGGIDPLLARPISIYYTEPESGEVAFLFKVAGHGTAVLAERKVGERLTLLGPLGVGFHVPEQATEIALIAGGVGMPPLYFLARALRRERPACTITLIYGGRSAGDLLELARWEALGVTVVLTTDDGSAGRQGLVTEAFQYHLTWHDVKYLAACGPKPMLRAVQRLALAMGIAGEFSMEARMACGVGACLGCVCGTVDGNRRVCVDGPVFALDEVHFDA